MTEEEIAAQARLRAVAEELVKIRTVLQGVAVSLPASPGEATSLEEGGELRAVIECVLNDSIEPAIRDLQTAASTRGR